MPLNNRVALITGGSRGIGKGIAVRLAQEGARIAIAYRSNKMAAQQTLRQLQASGADCVAVETDISEAPRAEQLVQTVVDRYGRLDIVVNNVGDFRWGALAESSLEEWNSIFSSNLSSVVYVSRAALPHMRRGRWGPAHQFGRGGRRESFWAGENFCVCRGEGGRRCALAVVGLGRSKERNHRERGQSFEHRRKRTQPK